ncbi:hypothetical protein BKA67DRAFT_413730 [Truncatella angustata]|uniref:Uncharacterized protein n=1 Tax=Truncatella angustata TaxID=152316 RepID=A0A9P8UBY2_9PEZI|nr:uncharacterized protein BKA67DRAFT_413730 [Truncatella angustata]KAH6646697.1 hypothetical protein BKA67DRAFT_413730 [Truncatella angustata]
MMPRNQDCDLCGVFGRFSSHSNLEMSMDTATRPWVYSATHRVFLLWAGIIIHDNKEEGEKKPETQLPRGSAAKNRLSDSTPATNRRVVS